MYGPPWPCSLNFDDLPLFDLDLGLSCLLILVCFRFSLRFLRYVLLPAFALLSIWSRFRVRQAFPFCDFLWVSVAAWDHADPVTIRYQGFRFCTPCVRPFASYSPTAAILLLFIPLALVSSGSNRAAFHFNFCGIMAAVRMKVAEVCPCYGNIHPPKRRWKTKSKFGFVKFNSENAVSEAIAKFDGFRCLD
ncbi:hypothetical protein U1Q18_038524 [Sarracenia purpurea var. burkii]